MTPESASLGGIPPQACPGSDSDGLDYDIAIDMIHAALDKQPLAVFAQ